MHMTRLCLNNATDFNKVTQFMNLGPGELFMSYLKKSWVSQKKTQVLWDWRLAKEIPVVAEHFETTETEEKNQ